MVVTHNEPQKRINFRGVHMLRKPDHMSQNPTEEDFWSELRMSENYFDKHRLRLYWYGVDQLRADPSVLVSPSNTKKHRITQTLCHVTI